MWEDYVLIRKIQRGDTDAWELLVNKYYDKIFAYCYRRCYGNRMLASDLTQEVFLKLVQALPNYSYRGKFYNYLYTIAVNHCNTVTKKKQLEQVELDEKMLLDTQESVETYLVKQEEKQAIQEALNKLPDIQREALILRYYQDLKVRDIAKITGVEVSTAQSRIHQGLKKLAKWLDEKESSDD
ncbi:RNA polymerase sigma factor [Streptococcus ovis]|uniref:RNA polymerase sigma factor n=1 Tax=Streptococcus ovis TaxID=82806 RepID=UPI000361E42F|nr:RNA polymerase sigma factor [Streptococcus ovis]